MSTPVSILRGALHDLPEAPLVVGFSGGMDSTVLLHLLAGTSRQAGHHLRAVHVHHGLHPGADDWARHCQHTCGMLGVPLDVVRVEVEAPARLGPEGAAREARLQALAGSMQPGDALVLAHHRDDQAETFLLRALRASGPDGLASMRRWRDFGAGQLWRPLLDTPRAALLEYARSHQLHWVEDPSNASDGFDRNFLRNRVLPLLATRWPHAGAAFARAAELSGQAADQCREADTATLETLHAGRADGLLRAPLMALPAARRAGLLRRWTATLGLPPLPAAGVELIERELLPARPDAAPVYAWHGAWVRAWCDRVYAGAARDGLPPGWNVDWDGLCALPLPGGGTLALLGATGSSALPRRMKVHSRSGGERMRLPGRTHSHALKHVLQQEGVPPWERNRMPLLSDPEGELLAAGDRILAARFSEWLARHRLRLHWQRD